jgi:hypothetical protein
MPGIDGTGPRGKGPMSGRGEGYCVMTLPAPGTGISPTASQAWKADL